MKKVEAGGEIEVSVGEAFRVVRQTQSGGYVTSLRANEALRHDRSLPLEDENPQLIGGGVTIEEEYVALEAGEHELVFHVARPWETAGSHDVVTRIRAMA